MGGTIRYFGRSVRALRRQRGRPLYEARVNYNVRRSVQRLAARARQAQRKRPRSVGYLYNWQG